MTGRVSIEDAVDDLAKRNSGDFPRYKLARYKQEGANS